MGLRTSYIKFLIENTINEFFIFENPTSTKKSLRIFDFDDTLASTGSKVYVIKKSGKTIQLTPGEYAVYKKHPEDKFDYGDFEKLINPIKEKWVTSILKNVVNKYGPKGAMILTARGYKEPIIMFLKKYDIPVIPIVALGDSDPNKKAQVILRLATNNRFDLIEFFDDSPKNIKSANALIDKKSGYITGTQTKLITRLVKK